MPDVEVQRSAEWREYLRALRRLVLLALRPWPDWPHFTDTMIAAAGVVAPLAVGWGVSHLLVGLVVSLSVAVLLLLWAGTRVERELRGDFGIRLEELFDGQWSRLAVTNDSGKWARFRADVTAIEPLPPKPQESTWAIAWSQTSDREESIEPHGTQYLCFCRGDVTPRPGGKSGITTFKTVTKKILYYFSDAEAARSPIMVKVRVSRVGSHVQVERTYKVWHEYEDHGSDSGLFGVEAVDDDRPQGIDAES